MHSIYVHKHLTQEFKETQQNYTSKLGKLANFQYTSKRVQVGAVTAAVRRFVWATADKQKVNMILPSLFFCQGPSFT